MAISFFSHSVLLVISTGSSVTSVSILPSEQTVNVSENFTIGIYVAPSEPVTFMTLNLSFDPLLLQAEKITKGDFFSGELSFANGSINNTAGVVVIAGGVLSGNSEIPGYLVNISFTAGDRTGSSSLNLSDVKVDVEYGVELYNGTVTVIGGGTQNNPPVAFDDFYSTDEDTSLVVNAPGVLGNDYDADGDVLTAEIVSVPSHGSVTLSSDGSFTYTPDANYHGQDSFTYRAFDGTDYSNTATVNITINITVNSINHAPVAVDDHVTVWEDSSNNQIDVLGNDFDPDGDNLIIISVWASSHGVATYDNRYVYYTPSADYCGVDSFSYVIDDGNGSVDVATIHVTVTCVNDPPMIVDEVPLNGSSNVSVSLSQLSVAIRDAEGDLFDWSIKTVPDIGSNNGSGFNGSKYCFVSGLDYDTVYTWYVNATDSNGDGVSAVFTFRTEKHVEEGNYTLIVDAGGPYNGVVGENISFSGSVVNGTPPYTWFWDFGDGNISTEENPVHVYYESGEYLVGVTVFDRNNATGSGTTVVKVVDKAKDGDAAGGESGGETRGLMLFIFFVVLISVVGGVIIFFIIYKL